jgi:release factor glutamine methyltransferase
MVARLVAEGGLAIGADVLDMFTGSGALALSAARLGARSVTAVDISRRALATVRFNARRNRVSVRTRRSDLFSSLGEETFDLILANPPYYPGEPQLPRRGIARAWDGGERGRVLIDALCAQAPPRLRPGGTMLLVHATFNGEAETVQRLEDGGLSVEVVHRHVGPFGAVGRARVLQLRREGSSPTPRGADEEETIVISARRPAT